MTDTATPANPAHKAAHTAYPITILILSAVSPAMPTSLPTARGGDAGPNVARRARPRQSAQGGRGLVECTARLIHAGGEIGELAFGHCGVGVADRLVHRG